MMKKYRKKVTLQKKQLTVFACIILVIMSISLGLHLNTVKTMRQMTYDKMRMQGNYYQNLLDNEIGHILQKQVEFFNDRKLMYLERPEIQLEPYDRREALLSLREKLGDITAPDIVENAVLYIPQNGYKISPGAVRTMSKADREEMDQYCSYTDGVLNYDGTNYFAMRIVALGNKSKKNPSFVLIVTLSSEKLEYQLNQLLASPDGGAFYYREDLNVLLKSEEANHTAEQILQKIVKEKDGNYQEVSRIKMNQQMYLVFAGEKGSLGVLMQYVKENPILEYVKDSWSSMIVFIVIMILMAIAFIWYNNKMIHRPMHILLDAFARVQNGNLAEKIHHKKEDEFAYLYQGFNEMEDRVQTLIREVAQQTDLAQKSQLKQLQAQINPHFLYNSFFILSRRIKRQDYENAEEFAKHLGNYFKYLARDGADYIPLVQEAEHAQSYAAIQNVRFSNRISVKFENVPELYRNCLVPRLILQPLLENAYHYGLENKVESGILLVSFREELEGIHISVEDNGDEVSDQDILNMQELLANTESEEVTGIVNIHRRLRLYYNNRTGLVIERSNLGGVAVSINIPCEQETKL